MQGLASRKMEFFGVGVRVRDGGEVWIAAEPAAPRNDWFLLAFVIASEARRSIVQRSDRRDGGEVWIAASPAAPRNDFVRHRERSAAIHFATVKQA